MYVPEADVFNLGDLSRRLAELNGKNNRDEGLPEDEAGELEALRQLSLDVPDWQWERPLVAGDYFEEFAREETDSIHGVDVTGWPFNHIDWEAAAAALEEDYHQVEFAGQEYWVRS